MANAAIHGRFGALFVDQSTAANGSPSPLGNLSDWTVSGKRDLVEVTVLGEANKSYVSGLSDFSGQLNGVLDTSTSGLFTVADGVARKFYLYIDNTSGTTQAPIPTGKGYWYGSATFAGVDTKAGVSAAVTWSINWSASGSITKL